MLKIGRELLLKVPQYYHSSGNLYYAKDLGRQKLDILYMLPLSIEDHAEIIPLSRSLENPEIPR
jgi:hypothetical protein